MPVLELSELITAIGGYGSGIANQKMVTKCMFFFALFTIFSPLLGEGGWMSPQCVSLHCFQVFWKASLCL